MMHPQWLDSFVGYSMIILSARGIIGFVEDGWKHRRIGGPGKPRKIKFSDCHDQAETSKAMTLDDFLKEHEARVTFEYLPKDRFPLTHRITCSLTFPKDDDHIGSLSEGVIMYPATLTIISKGNTVSEAFSEAIKKLETYSECPK
jgi:hypothetical protein